MEGVRSEAERSAFAAQIFGDDAGPKLRLLLDQGADGMARLQREARDIGAVLSDDVIKNAVQAQDKLAKLSNVVKAQLSTALVTLAPVISKVSQAIVDLSKSAQLAFGDIDNLSADLLIQKLENLDAVRDDLVTRLKEAEANEADNSFLGAFNRVFSRDVEVFRAKIKEIDDEIIKTELALGKKNFAAVFAPEPIDLDVTTNVPIAVREAEKAFKDWKASIIDVGKETSELQKRVEFLDEALFKGKITTEAHRIELEKLTGTQSEYTQTLNKVQERTEELSNGAIDMGFAFQSAFEDAVLGGEKFSEVLKGLGRDLAQVVLREAVTVPFGTAVAKGVNSFLPGFADGGTFTVGGSGGTDSQLVAFRATPGEQVTVATPGQQNANGVTIINNIDARGAHAGVETRIRQAMQLAVDEATRRTFALIERGGVHARAVGRTA